MAGTVVDLLVHDPEGGYLDATAGGGGHSEAILDRLGSSGRLIAVDRDSDAFTHLSRRFAGESRVKIVRANFKDIRGLDLVTDSAPLSGVLFDFGVSSHMLDSFDRGFSYRGSGPLDMRMDDRRTLSASEVVNSYDESRLAGIFKEYGEERRARKLAAAIMASRPVGDTGALAAIIRRTVPGREQVKTLSRVFQAIRIEVNGELSAIREALPAALELLERGGRLVTLAYHSLEDRIVKRFIRNRSGYGMTDPFMPIQIAETVEIILKPLFRGARKASAEEIAENPRARSVRLRAAEKIV